MNNFKARIKNKRGTLTEKEINGHNYMFDLQNTYIYYKTRKPKSSLQDQYGKAWIKSYKAYMRNQKKLLKQSKKNRKLDTGNKFDFKKEIEKKGLKVSFIDVAEKPKSINTYNLSFEDWLNKDDIYVQGNLIMSPEYIKSIPEKNIVYKYQFFNDLESKLGKLLIVKKHDLKNLTQETFRFRKSNYYAVLNEDKALLKEIGINPNIFKE